MHTFLQPLRSRPLRLAVLALAAFAAFDAFEMPPRLAAQDVRLTGLSGEQLGEAEMAHGTTIVVAWASWSPRSRDIVERIKILVSHWGAKAKVVTLDFEEDRQTVQTFLAGKSPGAPTFLDADGAFCRKYAIATLPGLLVIKDGKSIYHGKLPDDADSVISEAIR
jgi:thiol-disulfide isomerase/thioredoxin